MTDATPRVEEGEKPESEKSKSDTSNGLTDSGSPDATDNNFTQERKITGFRWVVVIISILSSVTLYSLDNTIVADIQPDIIEAFGELSKLPWLSVAFLVACVSTNSIWGKIYAQLNAKWLYLLCVVLFEVGSAICGAAPSMNALIGAFADRGPNKDHATLTMAQAAVYWLVSAVLDFTLES